MDKVDAGYNFGSRNTPIPDDVDDDRTIEDIVRQFDQIGDDNWDAFEPDAPAMADNQIWNYFAVSTQARDNVLKRMPVCEKLYALFLTDNDTDFLWAMNHLDDDQFISNFSWDTSAGKARDKVLLMPRCQGRIFGIFSTLPAGVLALQCSWIGEDQFLAYFESTQDARDKILGTPAITDRFYAVLEEQKKSVLKTIGALMSDEQLQEYVDSSEARMKRVRAGISAHG